MSGELAELDRETSDIPENWDIVALSDCLADFRNGWTYDTRALDGTLPITRIETISNGVIDYGRIGFAQPEDRIEAFKLDRNDILFSHINSVEHIAKVAIKVDDRPLYHGMNLMRLRPNERVVPDFLFARLQSEQTRDHFRSVCKRAVNQASLNKGEIGSYEFLLPPLDEQRRIAEVLRSVDEAIAANHAAVDAARRTLEAWATEIVAEASDTRMVADFGTVVTGGTPSPKNADLWGGDLPFVTPGDLDDECISVRDAARSLNASAPHRARVLPANSVLVTCIGSTVGKVAISRRECATNQQINAVCCDPALAGYVYLACLAAYDEIVANAGKQAVPIINKSTFSGLALPYFPRERLLEISEAVDALDDERERSVAALSRLTSMKTSLMSDLLSGRVRVPA